MDARGKRHNELMGGDVYETFVYGGGTISFLFLLGEQKLQVAKHSGEIG